jgi:hypothetical protein
MNIFARRAAMNIIDAWRRDPSEALKEESIAVNDVHIAAFYTAAYKMLQLCSLKLSTSTLRTTMVDFSCDMYYRCIGQISPTGELIRLQRMPGRAAEESRGVDDPNTSWFEAYLA